MIIDWIEWKKCDGFESWARYTVGSGSDIVVAGTQFWCCIGGGFVGGVGVSEIVAVVVVDGGSVITDGDGDVAIAAVFSVVWLMVVIVLVPVVVMVVPC